MSDFLAREKLLNTKGEKALPFPSYAFEDRIQRPGVRTSTDIFSNIYVCSGNGKHKDLLVVYSFFALSSNIFCFDIT